MIYRMRIYHAEPNGVAAFNEFFNTLLLPVQLRHGARLVGRWQTEDLRIVAVWEYDSRQAYEEISARVRSDPDFALAQARRRSLPRFFSRREEVFMSDTVVLATD